MLCPNISGKSIESKVFLATENRLLRDTLARLLRKQSGLRVAGVSAGFENLTGPLVESACDTLLTDTFPGSTTALLFRNLREQIPQLKLILIGMEDDPETFLKAIHLGTCGYVLKEASALEIVAAIRRVGRGEAVCPPNLCMVLIEYVWTVQRKLTDSPDRTKATENRLTHRQVQLMNLVASGLSNKEIAATLNLSQFTVKNHLRRVMRQVEATNRYDAVEMVRASGLLGETRRPIASE